jgi:acid phosphatase family membrane protein YuiD
MSVVLWDACSTHSLTRREGRTGGQVINRIMSDCIVSDMPHPALKEVLGHTPLQVLAGAVLGVAVGVGYGPCLKYLVVV